jgi:hypothetical protein
MTDAQTEIAAAAARWVVEDGMEFGPAKRRAAKQLGLTGRADLPDNATLECAVVDYVTLFCADTQPAELLALRRLALHWMERLAPFRPYLSGSVWHGYATRLSDIYLQLFCDDSKSAEITLIDQRLSYQVQTVNGLHGAPVDALSLGVYCDTLKQEISLHLMIYDHNDVRGALKADAKGRTPRGDIQALRRLMPQDML